MRRRRFLYCAEISLANWNTKTPKELEEFITAAATASLGITGSIHGATVISNGDPRHTTVAELLPGLKKPLRPNHQKKGKK